jgi:hypothetical protein
MPDFESFCVYGFHTVYPNTWRVEFDPKSNRSKGDVVFKSPEKDNIFLSWGPLEKAENRFSDPEGHLKYSIDRIKKNTRVGGVEVARKNDLEIHSHKALVSLLKVTFSMPSIVQNDASSLSRLRQILCNLWTNYDRQVGDARRNHQQHGQILQVSRKITS